MKDRFESLESGEVVSIQHDKQVLIGHSTFRVGELNEAIKHQLESTIDGWSEDKSAWFDPKGIDCEALRFGSAGWQKGRIRLCLQFCPDEPSPAAEATIGKPLPMTAAAPPIQVPTVHTASEQTTHANLPPITAPTLPEHAVDPTNNGVAATAEATAVDRETGGSHDLPLAGGVAIGTVAVGAAVAAVATHPASEISLEELSLPQPEAASSPIATEELIQPEAAINPRPHAEAVLMLEDDRQQPNDLHSTEMDEIAFDFDRSHGDGQGKLVPDGLMDLDLTDLDLDRAEQDYLNFETAGMPDGDRELVNLQDLGRAENSGVLDEVWQELSQQPNWPGIH